MKRLIVVIVTLASLTLVACDAQEMSAQEVEDAVTCGKMFAVAGEKDLSPADRKARDECLKKNSALVNFALANKQVRQQFEERIFRELDEWVRGGSVEDVNSRVIPACARLVSLYATSQERKAFFAGKDRAEWDFRVDFCAKGTVHRRWPQPEFANTSLVAQLCTPDNRLWIVVCERAGIVPARSTR